MQLIGVQHQQRERGVGVGESMGGASASNSNMASLGTANFVSTLSSQPGRTLIERQHASREWKDSGDTLGPADLDSITPKAKKSKKVKKNKKMKTTAAKATQETGFAYELLNGILDFF